ncbi:MAG: serine hydrolase domain-containing protein [Pseudomonadota bacterium]
MQAQQESTGVQAQIEQILREQFDEEGPGYSVLVVQHGETVYQEAYGKANIELGTPLQPDNVFRIASLTKPFTAMAILQLVEQGKLSLQDDITQFLPDYPKTGITVEHLLTHTSGTPDFTKLPTFTAETARQSLTVPQQIDRFKNEPLDFEPGSGYRYTNSGYTLLGRIIEVISNLPYDTYMQRYVFTPHGLNHTYYGQDATIIPGRAHGYSRSGEDYINAAYVNDMLPYASGALLSTTNDLYTWHKALIDGKVIDLSLLDTARSPFTLSTGEENGYGYGWQIGIMNDQPVIFHSGAINGFLADMLYLPESDLFVVMLANCDCNPPAMSITQIVTLLVE